MGEERNKLLKALRPILEVLGLKETGEEEYSIECPYCDGEAPYIGCDEESQAIHYCPNCEICFKVLWNGTILVAEAEGSRIIIEEI